MKRAVTITALVVLAMTGGAVAGLAVSGVFHHGHEGPVASSGNQPANSSQRS